jgi:hypothetical protein
LIEVRVRAVEIAVGTLVQTPKKAGADGREEILWPDEKPALAQRVN